VSNRELISALWAAMQTNDWEKAAGYLALECVIDWPCSGERIVGRTDFAAVRRAIQPAPADGASRCTGSWPTGGWW